MVGGRTNQPTSKVIRSIRERLPSAIIIVIGDTNEPRVALNTLEAGANGYLREAVTLQTLMITLALALAGYLRGHPAALQQSSIIDADLQFTERELVILKGLANGLPNKVIAKSLAITEATVKVHVKTVFRKIRAKNRTQAAVWALKNINGSSIEH
jgi:two-component system nitrate/nitrite response regulator NarL